ERLKSSNIYSEEGRLTVGPFSQDEVSLLQGSVGPRDLAPDHVRQVLMELERFLGRHSDELTDEPHIEPRWGPLLNPRIRASHPRLLAPLRRLADAGIAAATRRRKAASPDQHGMVQVGIDWRRRYSASSDDAALHAATVDLKDGVYQLKIPHLSEWFAFDMPGVRAKELGAQQVYDGGAGSYAWLACGGLATGWPWALWIRRETLARAMGSSAGPRDAVVLDKAPAARLEQGAVGDLPHVDNANIIGVERDLVQAWLERMMAALDLLGLKWHGRRALASRPQVGQRRAFLGHLVSFFQLLRPGLAVFRILCDFAQQGLGEIRELPAAAQRELKVARSLLFMAVGRWGLPPCPVAFMTDAPAKGYALPGADATPDEVHDLCRFRERARFSRRDRFAERERDGFKGSMAPRGPVPERCRVEVDLGWRPPPLPDDFADPKRWELVVAGAWRDASRMRDFEARCELMGPARAASYPPCHNAELLSAGGSMGPALSFEKGRAANGELLAQCRRAAALQLAAGTVRRQRHVEGARNAADYMSWAADRGVLRPGQVWRGPRGQVGQRSRWGRRFFLEIFPGEGCLTGAILEAGLGAGPPVDLEKGPHFDIADPMVQKVVIGWIRSGVVWLMHLATPCARWSIARSSGAADPVVGLVAARFTARLIQECRRAGVNFTLENPRRSRLWTWRPLARALRSAASTLVDLCQRRFGAPFQKPTRILLRPARCSPRWAESAGASDTARCCRAPAAAARLPEALGLGAWAGGRASRARTEPREQAPGLLRRATVRQATAAPYSDCVEEPNDYIARSGGGLADPHAAGATLERHFEALFLGGERPRPTLAGASTGWPGSAAGRPRAALPRRPSRPPKAGAAWGPPGSRGPAVRGAVLAAADDLIGRELPSTLAGALLPVAFDGYLRPPAALGLRGADILRPQRSTPQRLRAATVAPATQPIPSNTSALDDTVFLGSAAKGHGFVGGVLDVLLARAGKGQLFGGLTLAQLEAIVNAACRLLQLAVAFTPRCLRHGGASRDALGKFEDALAIPRRGRWKARESVRRYEKASTLL
ncbi:unnamed protein product, partial [Prorocentrum cordatum]